MLWVYSYGTFVRCRGDQITNSALPVNYCDWNYNNNQQMCRRLTSYIKPQMMIIMSVPTKWRRNAVTVDKVELINHHVYRIFTGFTALRRYIVGSDSIVIM